MSRNDETFNNDNFSQSTRAFLNVQVLLVITSNSSSYWPKTYPFIYQWVCTYFLKTFDFRPLISKLFRRSLNFPLVTKLTWQKVWIFCFWVEKISLEIYSTGLLLRSWKSLLHLYYNIQFVCHVESDFKWPEVKIW